MKTKQVIIFIILLLTSHYIHYLFNKVRNPFYNTIFSSKQTLQHFYNIELGEPRSAVESRIGKPLSQDGNRFYYSKPGNALFFNNYWVSFRLNYNNDTVVAKYVYFDD